MTYPPHHLYIHVPFCAKKCNYCAFHSVATKPNWDKYAADIKTAIRQQPRCSVPTIFFGGGTPSLMPPAILEQILTAAHDHFDIDKNAEISLEMNPNSNAELNTLRALGISRISVGAQSFNDDELQFLGRIHSAKEARATITAAMNLGFNVSADFIYALPNQTLANIKNLCSEIQTIGLPHASLYELTIEPNTPFFNSVSASPLAAEMFIEIDSRLRRYEVSNYAKPGHECRHNSGIWAGDPYIGLGPAAAGRIFDGQNWTEQYSGALRPLSNRDRAIEMVITGLRTTLGVSLTPDILSVLNLDFIKKNNEIYFDNSALSLTPAGLLILDSLLPDIIN